MRVMRWATVGAMAESLILACTAWAGDLTPPGPPGPTMHTLEEIYQKVEQLGQVQMLSDTTTVVQAGYYAQTTLQSVEPDLVASNIRAGVVLFGITGTCGGATSGPPSGMVLIPEGSFVMGNPFGGEGADAELPLHTNTISAFYMDATEVTQAKWDEVYTWAVTHEYSFDNSGSGKSTNHPVCVVNWYDCVKWANARSEREELEPCYTHADGTAYKTGVFTGGCNWAASGYRLPTEAEWEKAARGGAMGHRFPWSDTNRISHALANYNAFGGYGYDDSDGAGLHPTYDIPPAPRTGPVGSFAQNGYGLYDMAGNVHEWCWDWYLGAYYASSPGTDPRGPASGSFRLRRGGSWSHDANLSRVASRNYYAPDAAYDFLGFRLVRAAP